MGASATRGDRLAPEAAKTVRSPHGRTAERARSWRDPRAVQRAVGNRGVGLLLAGDQAAAGPAALLHAAVSDGGAVLDPQLRGAMEARLGHPFGDVRVHTGAAAHASAIALDAAAYTVGPHIVFAAGRYAPRTPNGMRTLAHELTHVVQQRNGPVAGRATVDGMRVSDAHDAFETAAAHTAAEIGHPPGPAMAPIPAAPPAPAGELSVQRCGDVDPEHCPCHGGAVVQRQSRRDAGQVSGPPAAGGAVVPRPPVLPLNQGFTLYALDGLPPEVAAAIPEGSTATLALRGAEATGVGAWSGLAGGYAQLRTFGLPGSAAGADAIGLVAIPRVNLTAPLGSPRFSLPDPVALLDTWGHTAVYVRQGGRIVAVRGFNPATSTAGDLLALLSSAGKVEAGRSALPGVLSSDAYLFTSNAAKSIEYPVAAEQLTRFLGELPDVGPGGRPGVPSLYTARPSVWAAGQQPPLAEPFCIGSNCGLWAVERVEQALGGPVGRPGGPSVTAVTGRSTPPVAGTASQGQVMALMEEAEAARLAGRASPLAEMPGATGAAVAGRVPAVLRVVKIGGRVLLVVGIVAAGVELATARPADRPRVAAGIAGGFAGGFLLGAGAGLVCGPGAPVCSIVAGLVLGTVGALGGRAVAEGMYDSLHTPRDPHAYPGHSIVCPSCHDNPAVRESGARFLSPGGTPPLDTFRRISTLVPGRSNTLSPAEVEQLRAWLGEPAR